MAVSPPVGSGLVFERIKTPDRSAALGARLPVRGDRPASSSNPGGVAAKPAFETIDFKKLGSTQTAKAPANPSLATSVAEPVKTPAGEVRQSFSLQTLSAIAGVLVGELDAATAPIPQAGTAFTALESSGSHVDRSSNDKSHDGERSRLQVPGEKLDISV